MIVLFFRTSRPSLDPPSALPSNGQREVKRLERESTRSLASRVEVKNEWSCASTRRPQDTTARLALHVGSQL